MVSLLGKLFIAVLEVIISIPLEEFGEEGRVYVEKIVAILKNCLGSNEKNKKGEYIGKTYARI